MSVKMGKSSHTKLCVDLLEDIFISVLRDHQPKGAGDVVEQGEEREGREPCLVPTSLIFGKIVDIQEISNVGFPEQYFNFAAYNELPARANVRNAILTEGNPKNGSSTPPPVSSKPALVLDDSCLLERDFSKDLMGKVKDVNSIPNLPFIFSKEGFPNVRITYLGGLWVLLHLDSLELKEKISTHTGVRSWAWTSNAFQKDLLRFWGVLWNGKTRIDDALACKRICIRTKVAEPINERVKIIIRGNMHWIRAKELDTWGPNFDEENVDSSSEDEFEDEEEKTYSEKQHNQKLMLIENEEEKVSETSCKMHVMILCMIAKKEKEAQHMKDSLPFPPGFPLMNDGQHSTTNSNKEQTLNKSPITNKNEETKMEQINNVTIKALWGNFSFDFAASLSVGNSGGILCVWDLTLFVKDNVTKRFLLLLHTLALWLVKDTWMDTHVTESNKLLHLHKKLQVLKASIKVWQNDQKNSTRVNKSKITTKLSEIDKTLDQGAHNDEILIQRSLMLKDLHNIDSIEVEELAQKAKIRWALKRIHNLDVVDAVREFFYIQCFFLASGLKINLQKSKLMGIGINKMEVDKAARLVGCSTFSTPFNYLGVKVGDVMSKVKS
ncbi:hypothetical protein Tco_0823026 [Tanacetum coccineum]|uniref:RNA-directed DNA polymerase, eukaryota, reverse transcriptase zinc-binding domain protein n=1 Tax=Tanacetum coccineum TaxID=301880 RepID=A0ABQ5AK20_9ASTR